MPSPKHSQYRIKRGDSLSKIALGEYGDMHLWPQIASANNIPNGNHILVGMNLKLPVISASTSAKPAAPIVGPPVPGSSQLSKTAVAAARQSTVSARLDFPVAHAVAFPALKYKLDTLPPIVVSTPSADFRVRLTGEIAIQQKGIMSEVEFAASGGISQKLKAEYDSKLIRLADQIKVKWDFSSLTAEVSCGFTIASKVNGREFVSHTYDYVPPNKFKYTLKPREVSGEKDNLLFKGTFGYELEITAKTNTGASGRMPVPSRAGNQQWVWVTVGGLTALGTIIIVADIAKDLGTLGLGVAESPLSWSAAMALFARAAQLAR